MRVGDTVPEFELPDETGTPRRLSGFLGDGPVVLFFYPAALTAGCTLEACHFRDLAVDFKEHEAQRVGISPDRIERLRLFADRYGLGFPLLSDPGKAVAAAFGARRRFGFGVRRITFLIGRDGVVADVNASEVNMITHADRALYVLRRNSGP
ncbi:peroxiredoxin [Rhizohabitans arisaemae]|uniref:peroxiredoxin n=1 Tax=Rhizohabitans arisaemae TaxID=2720610 RepID=UPI0024B1D4A8|nr:peroxiredoxin [Rhizohabitans arisaemae]